MTILSTELLFYNAETVSDAATNGGIMGLATTKKITSSAVQNVFPHVFSAERIAGSTKYRKVFAKVANDADDTLIGAQLWLDAPTAADDFVVFCAGTQTNTQGDLTGSERIYGCAAITSDIAAGGQAIVVEVEDAAITGIYQVGDTIQLTDKTTPDSATGNAEQLTIDTVAVSGSQVTIGTVEVIGNDYLVASGSRVASVYEPGDIVAAAGTLTVNSSAGTYDDTTYPVLADNIGSVAQTVTLTFLDSANFTAVSNVAAIGTLPAGSTGTDYAPSNANFSKPYFTLKADGWGGTWAAGDTLTVPITPAAAAVWEKRVVPAGAASMASNKVTLVMSGESA